MSDDFDDDLYNVYNGGGQEDTYNDEDLYGEDPVVDVKAEGAQTENEETTAEHDQHDGSEETQNMKQEDGQSYQQQNQQNQQQQQQQQQRYQQQNMMNNNMNWGFQGNPYQQYMAAYQRNLQQQMAMNPYQMQQMFQRQMRQQMPQQQHNNNNNNTNNRPQQAPMKRENNAENTDSDKVNPDEGKMFIGGLNWETTDESLRQYFSQFGEVLDCTIMRDPTTQRSRGFAFLTMKENSDIDKIVSQSDHHLDGKRIDPKRAIPRDEQDKTEKIFVGGISAEVNEEEFREFFTQFGTVIDATLMLDRETGRPRGFGFVTFENSNGVEEALKNSNLSIKDKTIEVKKAMPKNRQQQNRMAAPVLNPNFRPQQGGYMPNSRYAGAANYGNMMGRNNFNNMYAGNMYGGAYNNMAAAAAAAAAAYYNGGDGGGNSNNNYQRGGSGSGGSYRQQQHHHQQDDSRSSHSHDHRRGSRDRSSHSHHQSSGNSGSGSGGGGAVHASQSRNQQHYRPY